MRVALLTGTGVEHRYVTSRFVEAFGEELAAVVVATGVSRPPGKRLKGYFKRYSIPQILSRICARLYRKRHGLDERRVATYERVLNPPAPDPGLYTTVPTHNGKACLRLLDELEPDVIAVYGTGIIRKRVGERARAGVLNMHTGLAPKYRGSDTIFWPLHNEEPEWVGVTVHELTPGIDAGPILATGRPDIEADDDEDSLFAKSVIVGTELYVRQVRAVADGTSRPIPQDGADGREYRFVDRTAAAEKRVAKLIEGGLLRRYVAGKKK